MCAHPRCSTHLLTSPTDGVHQIHVCYVADLCHSDGHNWVRKHLRVHPLHVRIEVALHPVVGRAVLGGPFGPVASVSLCSYGAPSCVQVCSRQDGFGEGSSGRGEDEKECTKRKVGSQVRGQVPRSLVRTLCFP